MSNFAILFRVISRFGPGRAVLLVGLLLINSLLEGFGIASLLPLLLAASGGQSADASPLAQTVSDMITAIGLPQEVWILALLSAILLIMREVIGFAIRVYTAFVVTDIIASYRRRLLEAIVQARLSWYYDRRLGGMAISLAHFTDKAAVAMEMAVHSLTLYLRTAVYFILVVLMSYWLALGIIAGGALLFVPLLALIRMSNKYSRKHAGAAENLSAYFTDVFASIKTIKAMGLDGTVRPLFETFINRMKKFRRRIALSAEGLNALQNIAALILVFGLMAYAVGWLQLSVVESGVIAGLMHSTIKTFSRAQRYLQLMNENSPYLDRIEELIASARDAEELSPGTGKPSLEREIVFRDVVFNYTGKSVLDHASFTIPAGQVTTFIGPSGSGKTTIIDLISGLYVQQSGEILIDDEPFENLNLRDWRDMIGYVPQELILLSGTVRNNITLGADIDEAAIHQAVRLAGADSFVSKLPEGIDTDLGERGLKLSGGQRQRLSLARALVRKPKLLILDEVTSALDPDTEKELVRQISDLSGGEMTIVAITHNKAWLTVSDKVLHLENGKVPALGGSDTRSIQGYAE